MKGYSKISKLGCIIFIIICLVSASISTAFAADSGRSAKATYSVVKTGEVYTYIVNIKNTSTNPKDSIYRVMIGYWFNHPMTPPFPLKDVSSMEGPVGWTGSILGGSYYQGNTIRVGARGSGSSSEKDRGGTV
jgi:hypothetical protein